MRRALTIAVAVATLLGLAAEASAAVKIKKIYFDSPGSDGGSNKSLNHEYVVIKNSGSKAVVLSSWRLRDKANHVFDFPKFTLQPGSSVTVHTGK